MAEARRMEKLVAKARAKQLIRVLKPVVGGEMSKSRAPLGDRVYGGLLRLLPFDFRSEFGTEMEEVFREQRAETGPRARYPGLLRMWGATAADIFRMAPREHLGVLAQDTRYALRMMRRNSRTPSRR